MNETSALLGPVVCASEAAVKGDVHVTLELEASIRVLDCTFVSKFCFCPVFLSDKLMLVKRFEHASVFPVPSFSLPVTTIEA